MRGTLFGKLLRACVTAALVVGLNPAVALATDASDATEFGLRASGDAMMADAGARDFDAQAAVLTGAEYTALLAQLNRGVKDAQAAYATTSGQVLAAQQDFEQAKDAYEQSGSDIVAARDEEKAGKAALDAAQSELDAAYAAAANASAALESAKSAATSADAGLGKAVMAEYAARDAVSAAEGAVAEKAAQLASAQQAEKEAQAVVDSDSVVPTKNVEEWTALGLFKYIRNESAVGSAAYIDAQCAIDILTGTTTEGMDYPLYQGAAQDGAKAAENPDVYKDTNLENRNDAASLNNVKTSIGWIDAFNECREKENNASTRAGTATLSTDVGLNCRLMAIAIVNCNWSKNTYLTHRGHSQAFHVGENLSWGYRDPFDGWYVEEKADYDKGDKSSAGHYLNIVDNPDNPAVGATMATGFATATDVELYGIAHDQVFYTTSGYSQYNPIITYSTKEFRERFFDGYYQRQVEAGMNGVTIEAHQAHEEALESAKAAVQAAGEAKADADAALAAAESAYDKAQKATAEARDLAAQRADDVTARQAAVDAARQAVADKQTARDEAKGAYDAAAAALERVEAEEAESLQLADDFEAARSALESARVAASAAAASRDSEQQRLDAAGDLSDATVRCADSWKYSASTPLPPIEVVKEFEGKRYLLAETDHYSITRSAASGTGRAVVSGLGEKGEGTTWGSASVSYALTASGGNDSTAGGATTGKTAITDKNASVKVAGAGAYTGKARKPAVTVKVGGKTLKKGTDYTVKYSNNVKAGKKALVTITGSGSYSGTVEKRFTIAKAGNPMIANAKKLSVKAAKLKKAGKAFPAKSSFGIKKAKGGVTYKKVSGNAKIAVSGKGKVTLKKGLKASTYKVKVKVTAAGNGNYKKATKTVALVVKVTK